MVGEDVRVAHWLPCRPGALIPPSLEALVEDKDVDWEEEDIDEGVCAEDDSAGYVFQASLKQRRTGGVEGEGNIEGGRGVDGHDLWKTTRRVKGDKIKNNLMTFRKLHHNLSLYRVLICFPSFFVCHSKNFT